MAIAAAQQTDEQGTVKPAEISTSPVVLGQNWKLFQGGKKINRRTVLVKINLRAGVGNVTLPSEKLMQDGVKEVLKANDAGERFTFLVYKAKWVPETDRERQIASKKEDKPVEPGTELTVTPDWFVNKLKARFQEVCRDFGDITSGGDGLYVPAELYPAFKEAIKTRLEDYAVELREIVKSLYDKALQSFEQRLWNIHDVASFNEQQLSKIRKAFPNSPKFFDTKFGVFFGDVKELPSIIEQIAGDAEAMAQLAEYEKNQGALSYEQALNQTRLQFLQDLKNTQQQKLDEMIDSLCGVVAESLQKIDKVAGGNASVTSKMKEKLEEHATKAEALLKLIDSMAGINPTKLEDLVAKTNDLKSLAIKPKADVEKLHEAVQKLKAGFKETISLVASGPGAAELAQFCEIEDIATAPAPEAVVVGGEIDLDAPTPSAELLPAGFTPAVEIDLDAPVQSSDEVFVPSFAGLNL